MIPQLCLRPLFLFTLVLAAPLAAGMQATGPPAPARIILDTDMAIDVDDAGALALLHALADRGEAEILAVMHNTSYRWSVGAIDAINTWYGRPDIPIGSYKGDFDAASGKPYVRELALGFPNDVVERANAPDAALLYQQILAAQPDASVTIVSIGFMTNLRELMEHSQGGIELIEQKVKQLVVMGGGYPIGSEFNFRHAGIGPTTQYVIGNWPEETVPILFSGFEIGLEIRTGSLLRKTSPDNPVRAAYASYNGLIDRSSWDQTAVLAAVRGASPYWSRYTTGYNLIDADGSNTWPLWLDMNHTYLLPLMEPESVRRVIHRLMAAPPSRRLGPAFGRRHTGR